jgi:hypothetical protein
MTRQPGDVLSTFRGADGVEWRAVRGADRGRLQVFAVVPPSTIEQRIELLAPKELERWLSEMPPDPIDRGAGWLCVTCGTWNTIDGGRWCASCSASR